MFKIKQKSNVYNFYNILYKEILFYDEIRFVLFKNLYSNIIDIMKIKRLIILYFDLEKFSSQIQNK